jgi:voltage-gated potassium channel
MSQRSSAPTSNTPDSLRGRLYRVIFGVDTRAGRVFDVALLVCILLSVLVVMLDTVAEVRDRHEALLRAAGWVFTVLFSLEYLLRVYSAERRLRYAFSFLGLVDFLAVAPAWAGLFLPGEQYVLLTVVRLLRVLRVFRIFQMASYVEETRVLLTALRASSRRIVVFLLFVVTTVALLGALMYAVERGNPGFDSIPRSIYWAIVTLTTVGYGDIRPMTGLGQALAAAVMILGYSLIVVPTGFVSVAAVEAVRSGRGSPDGGAGCACPDCGHLAREAGSRFCPACGRRLERD